MKKCQTTRFNCRLKYYMKQNNDHIRSYKILNKCMTTLRDSSRPPLVPADQGTMCEVVLFHPPGIAGRTLHQTVSSNTMVDFLGPRLPASARDSLGSSLGSRSKPFHSTAFGSHALPSLSLDCLPWPQGGLSQEGELLIVFKS